MHNYKEARAVIFSSQRQQAISGWLLENNPGAFADNLKLQKYLFFYEMSIYMENPEEAELDHLRGYEKGTVFSNVYGDYRHDYFVFEDASRKSFTEHGKWACGRFSGLSTSGGLALTVFLRALSS